MTIQNINSTSYLFIKETNFNITVGWHLLEGSYCCHGGFTVQHFPALEQIHKYFNDGKYFSTNSSEILHPDFIYHFNEVLWFPSATNR